MRDFHMVGSFPLFEGVYQELRISTMSYAEKVNISGRLVSRLNEEFAASQQQAPQEQQYAAPQQQYAAPQQQYTPQQAVEGANPSRTHCVGGVADNTIGVS